MGYGEVHLTAELQSWVELGKKGSTLMSLDLHNALKILL